MNEPLEDCGIIVGTSQDQEWLLPWWWVHFRNHNNLPVTFVDYGDLSPKALDWCKSRGTVLKLELSDSFMAKKEDVDPERAALWDSMHSFIWSVRFTYYKKPFVLQLSPYAKTIWIDLDCQVRGSVNHLFELCENEGGIGVAPEHAFQQQINLKRNFIAPGEVMYNTGVIVYKKESKIIEEFAKQSKTRNHLFLTDQQLFADILNKSKIPFTSLSILYNWTVEGGFNPSALILHWSGTAAKNNIKQHIEFLNQKLLFNISFEEQIAFAVSSPTVKF